MPDFGIEDACCHSWLVTGPEELTLWVYDWPDTVNRNQEEVLSFLSSLQLLSILCAYFGLSNVSKVEKNSLFHFCPWLGTQFVEPFKHVEWAGDVASAYTKNLQVWLT